MWASPAARVVALVIYIEAIMNWAEVFDIEHPVGNACAMYLHGGFAVPIRPEGA